MMTSRRGSVRRERPRRKRAPPTPPASTVMVVGGTVPPDPPVERGALHGDTTHAAYQGLDLLHRRVLARVRARFARDALLHQRAAEVVAARSQRELRQAVAELHPRRLQVVDPAAQEEPRYGVDAQVAQPLRHRRDPAVVVELRVLPDEPERHELGEAARLLLERADQSE